MHPAGAATVPLQSTSTDAELEAILTETEPVIFAVSPQYLERATKLAHRTPSIRCIVLFDFEPDMDDHREAFQAGKDFLDQNAGPFLLLLTDILDKGERLADVEWPFEDEDDDPLAMLIYTSAAPVRPKVRFIPRASRQGCGAVRGRRYSQMCAR